MTPFKIDNLPRSIFLALFIFALPGHAGTPADAANGIWLNSAETGYVQIFGEDGLYYGQVAGATNGEVEDDTKNPDPALRDRSLLGQRVFTGFKFDGNGNWKGGEVYDPSSGKTYSAKMWLKDENTLKLRGFIGISLIGRTEILTRVPRDTEGVVQSALKPGN